MLFKLNNGWLISCEFKLLHQFRSFVRSLLVFLQLNNILVVIKERRVVNSKHIFFRSRVRPSLSVALEISNILGMGLGIVSIIFVFIFFCVSRRSFIGGDVYPNLSYRRFCFRVPKRAHFSFLPLFSLSVLRILCVDRCRCVGVSHLPKFIQRQFNVAQQPIIRFVHCAHRVRNTQEFWVAHVEQLADLFEYFSQVNNFCFWVSASLSHTYADRVRINAFSRRWIE